MGLRGAWPFVRHPERRRIEGQPVVSAIVHQEPMGIVLPHTVSVLLPWQGPPSALRSAPRLHSHIILLRRRPTMRRPQWLWFHLIKVEQPHVLSVTT